MGQAAAARRVLEAALELVRQVGDPYAEKLVVERLGMAHANMRDPAVALSLLNKALEMTRAVGDRQQETRVLWNQPFQHAAHCIIMSQGNGLRHSKLPRQGCIFRQVLVRLPALAPMPAPTLVVPGSSTVSRNSSLSQLSR